MIQFQQGMMNQQGVPLAWHIHRGSEANVTDICHWLIEQRPLIDSILSTRGALLIRGFNKLESAQDFEAAITAISPTLRDYVGGTSPREKVHGNIMTATYVPPSWSIPLHQEMAYTKNPPDRIAFFCKQAAEIGGDSTLGDMQAITRKIRPEIMEKFQQNGLQLRRTLLSAATLQNKPGVKKPWNEIFGTDDKDQIDGIAHEKGWRTEWLNEDTLQLWQEILPAIKTHPVGNQTVWFNQAHFFSPICMMAWAKRDGRREDYQQLADARAHEPDMLDAVFYGNGEPVSDEDAIYISQVLEESEIKVKMEKSDLLILDNTLVAHGRTAFSGQREILVALINVPEFKQQAVA